MSYRLNDLTQKLAALSEKPRAAAGVGTGTNAPEANAAPSVATSTSTTQVKLLEAGAEPRKVLRLHPSPGDKQTLRLTMKMAMETKMGGTQGQAMKLPGMTMNMDVTVKDVSDKGDITYEVVMGDTSVADDPGGAPQLAELMKAALGGAKGMSGTGTVSSRGLSQRDGVQSAAWRRRPNPPDNGSDEGFLLFAGGPLPEEAAGPGARWEVRRPIKSQGMAIDQTETRELVSIDGERVTTKSHDHPTRLQSEDRKPGHAGAEGGSHQNER